MSLQKILLICGIVAVVLLVFQFLIQIHRVKVGRANIGHGRVFINWLLLILIFVGFGGSIYFAHQPSREVAQPAKPTTPTVSKESTDRVTLDFDRKVELNDEGEKKVNFIVSPGTKVKIVGHYTRTVFKTIDDKTEFSYTFDNPGTYDIIATKGDKKVVKKLVVKDHSDGDDESSSSSASSTASSHSESAKASSNTSSTSNHNQSGNSGTSASNAGGRTSGGSNYSGGSAYRGGGGGYRGGGATYTPSRPSAPSALSAPSNGTGAMTGGSY